MVALGSEASGGRGGSSRHTPALVSTALCPQVPSVHGSYTLQYYTGDDHRGRWAFVKAKDGPLFWRVGRWAAPAAAFAKLSAAARPATAVHWRLQGLGKGLSRPQTPPKPPLTVRKVWGGERPERVSWAGRACTPFPWAAQGPHRGRSPLTLTAVLTPEIKGLRTMTSTLYFHGFFLVAVSRVVCLVFRCAWCVFPRFLHRSSQMNATAC